MSDSPLARKKAIIQPELGQLKRLIKRQYPDAVIHVAEGPEASRRSLWMDVFTDLVDDETLTDLIIERVMHLLEEKRFLLSVHALPLGYLPAPRARRTAPGKRVARERRAPYRAKSARRKEIESR